MDRRKFLKWGSFLTVSAASTTVLTACGGSSGDDDDDTTTAPPAGGGDNTAPPPPAQGAKLSFAQGVASGDPKPDSIVLWTRVEGADGNSTQQVTVQVATDDKFASMLVNTQIDADPSWD